MKKYSLFLSLDCFFLGILVLLPMLAFLMGDFLNTEITFTVVVFLAVVATFFKKNPTQRITVPFVFLSLILVYLFGHYLFISEVNNSTRFWTYVFYILCSILLTNWLTSNKKEVYLKLILGLFITSCAFQAVVALGQHFNLIPKNTSYFSLTGVFTSPNYLALYLSQGTLVLLWHLIFKKNTLKKEKGFLVLLSLLVSVLVMAKSRGTFIATGCSVGCLLFLYPKYTKLWKALPKLYKRGVLLLSATLLLGTALGLYTLNSDSINGRKLILKVGLKNIKENPVLGNGLFSFAGAYNKTKADYFLSQERTWEEIKVANYVNTPFNDYYLTVFEMGGLFCVLLLVLLVYAFKVKINRNSILAIALVLNALIWMLFNTAISSIFLMLPLLIGISILLANHKGKTLFKLPSTKSKLLMSTPILAIALAGMLCICYRNVPPLNTPKGTLINQKESKFYTTIFKDFRMGKQLYKLGLHEQGLQLMETTFYNSYYPKYGTQLFELYKQQGNTQKTKKIGQIRMGLEPFKLQPKIELAQFLEKQNKQEALEIYKTALKLPVKIKNKKATQYKKLANSKVSELLK